MRNNQILACILKNKELSQDYELKRINAKGHIISYYRINRKTDFLNNNTLSIYNVVDYKSLEEIGLFDDEREFERFQKEFFSDLFYNNRNDLRWNIYLIIVSDGEIKYDATLASIENNDDFMRKYFMSEKDFDLFISNAHIKKSEDINSNSNVEILSQWESILNRSGLVGCLYNKFSTGSVLDYIKKKRKIQTVGRPRKIADEISIDNRLRIKKVNSVSINSFRQHCFAEDVILPLGRVNLISGTNGSGKSSICEAIEYGLTGSIAGQNSMDDQAQVKVECTNIENEDITLSSEKRLPEIRKIDGAWYGTTSIGRKTTLNNNFSIFNYLKANASMKYENNDINLDELQKNLIFGEEVTQADLTYRRFYDEFNKELRFRNKDLSELNSRRNELEAKIVDSENTLVIWDKVNTILKSLFMRFEPKYYDFSDQEKLEYLNNAFGLTGESVKTIKQYVFNFQNDISINELLLKQIELQNKVKHYRLQEKDKYNLSEAINEMNKYIKSMLTTLEELDYTEYENIMNKIEKQFVSEDGMWELKGKYLYNKAKKDELSDIYDRYEDVFIEDEKRKLSDINFNQLESNLALNYSKLRELENEINNKRSSLSDISSLHAQLSDIGNNMVKLKGNDSHCPLCGHDYTHMDDLLKAIKNTEGINGNLDKELNAFIEKKNYISNKVEKLRETKELYIKKTKLVGEIQRLFNTEDKLSIKGIKELLNYEISNFNEYLTREKENYNFIINIENSLIYLDYMNEDDSGSLLEYCKIKIGLIVEKRNETKKEIMDLRTEISNKEIKLEEIKKVLLITENPLEELELINHIMKSVNIILSIFDLDTNNYKLYGWCQSYDMCNDLIFQLNKINNDVKQNDSNRLQIKSLNEKIHILQNEKRACNEAIDAFKSLKPLDDYMKDFITLNAGRIENIFKMIHKPKEFSNLSIHQGGVNFIRTRTGEIVDATKISTGQSVSLTFSILLALYMSAPNAPKLIILDEPIANMDDMHILNLIDIIREVALNGTQIIITTANEQVASFLRRKFSFMEDSFKHIILKRSNDEQTKIIEVIYSPNQEEYKAEKTISYT